MIRFFGHIGQMSALWWPPKWPKLFVYDNWPVPWYFLAMCTVGLWKLKVISDDTAIRPLDLLVGTKKSRKDWWNIVVWMQPVLYSSVLWHMCALVYLCWNTPCVNTYKPNVCLTITENSWLWLSQYIRDAAKILINCRHNLTNVLVVIMQHVQI